MADKTTQEPVPLPVLRGGNIKDTLSGFRERIEQDGRLGRRTERKVTMVFVDLRGWAKVVERVGADTAAALSRQMVERCIEILSASGGREIKVSGGTNQPRLSAMFEGEDSPELGLRAAWSVREAASASMHPAFGSDRYQVCIGVNTGPVADTRIAGSGMAFRATGTVKMFGQRLQEFAGPGQVLLSAETYNDVADLVHVRSLGSVRTNSDGSKQMAYCVLELRG